MSDDIPNQQPVSVNINLSDLDRFNPIDKMITAIASNTITLTLSLLLLFGGFFVVLGITGEALLTAKATKIDNGGRFFSGVIGIGALGLATWIILKPLELLRTSQPEQKSVEAALINMAEKHASLQLSSKITVGIKEIHKTQTEIPPFQLYEWLHKQGIINDHDYEELMTFLLKSNN